MEPLEKKIVQDLSRQTDSSNDHSPCVIACRFPFSNQTPTFSFEMGANSVWVYHNFK